MTSPATVAAYISDLDPTHATICRVLRKQINADLPKATSKLYHGSPVWFMGENAVVGFSSAKAGVKLMFWNGKTFKEEELVPVGKFKAAEIVFTDKKEIDSKSLRRWLKKARTDIWDFAGIRRAR
ncbi:MAG TPA: DUF1801 domain-containing protein [Gammaproteobacteria bacterium]